METTENGIKKTITKSGIEVVELKKSQYDTDGFISATLKQTVKVTTTYPEKSVGNDFQDSLFTTDELGIDAGKTFVNTENRIAFMNNEIKEGITKEQLQEKVNTHMRNGACLYKVTSTAPILTSGDKYAIEAYDNVTIDSKANSQVSRYPEGHKKAGKIITNNDGNVIYRRVFFSSMPKEDITLNEEVYMSPEIERELSEVVSTYTSETI